MGSLNVTISSPVPVLYTAEESVGFMVSVAVIRYTAVLFSPKRLDPSAPIRIEYSDLAGACLMLSVLPFI